MHLWLCHSPEDEGTIRQIAAYLEGRDLVVTRCPLFARDTVFSYLGDDIQPTDHLLVALSPHSVVSSWFQYDVVRGDVIEWAQRRAMQDSFVVPFLLKSCEVPIWLRDRVYANFANKSFEAACRELIKRLSGQVEANQRSSHDNQVLRTWAIDPVGDGKHAVLIEFGVSMQRARGLYIDVDLGAHYLHTKDWFGPANKPAMPARSVPFMNSAVRRQPPYYVRRFSEPDITPDRSYYLYVEANEPLRVKPRLFADANGLKI
jgi:hypothetical protein